MGGLKGGAITRAQALAVSSVRVASIRVHQCAANGELHCLAASYVSVCFHLGHAMPQFTEIIGLTEPQLRSFRMPIRRLARAEFAPLC